MRRCSEETRRKDSKIVENKCCPQFNNWLLRGMTNLETEKNIGVSHPKPEIAKVPKACHQSPVFSLDKNGSRPGWEYDESMVRRIDGDRLAEAKEMFERRNRAVYKPRGDFLAQKVRACKRKAHPKQRPP